MRAFLMVAVCVPLLLAAADAAPRGASPAEPAKGIAVRNPFWPIGYEGRREVITAEVRVTAKKTEPDRKAREVETAAAAAAKKARAEEEARAAEAKAAAERAERERIITPAHWDAALRSLRIAGRVKVRADDGTERSSVMINGRAYADGDLVSFTHGRNRFTWRVANLTSGTSVRLDRVKARHLGGEAGPAEPAKDNSAKGDRP